MRKRCVGVLGFTAWWLATGCARPPPLTAPAEKGVPNGLKITSVFGASGGTLATADGRFSVELPPGAVSTDTEIGIEPITNTGPLGIGDAYRLTPDGAKFSKPVKVTFAFEPSDYEGASPGALRVAYQDRDGRWRTWLNPTLDEVASSVTQETRHFTDFSMLLGWQLRPPHAVVEPSQSIQLELRYCEPEEFPSDTGDLVGLTPRCDLETELIPIVSVREWAVNGRAGGSSSVGTVAAQGLGATYTAPASAPASNPVAVSVEFLERRRGRGFGLAVSNITVGQPGWRGEITWTLTGETTTSGGGFTDTYRVSGSGRIEVVPGALGLGEVGSATATYREDWNQSYRNSYTFGRCNITTTQTQVRNLSGNLTGNAVASIVTNPTRLGSTITLGLPTGPITGRTVVDAAETKTGPLPECASGQPTHTDDPSTGSSPSHSFIITVNGPAEPTRLEGSETRTIDGLPPHTYSIGYSLRR